MIKNILNFIRRYWSCVYFIAIFAPQSYFGKDQKNNLKKLKMLKPSYTFKNKI